MVVDPGDYRLLQFHLHTPSEEHIDGKAYPLVAHFVHQHGDGGLAVVAVLFDEGLANPALQPVVERMPTQPGETQLLPAFDPLTVLPGERAYYAYVGSLTTPPCTVQAK